jgi:hypothetical protein
VCWGPLKWPLPRSLGANVTQVENNVDVCVFSRSGIAFQWRVQSGKESPAFRRLDFIRDRSIRKTIFARDSTVLWNKSIAIGCCYLPKVSISADNISQRVLI